MIEGNRRIVTVTHFKQIPFIGLLLCFVFKKITEKFLRNEEKPANKDVAVREFAIIDREIHLKYHYEKGKVTASTRDFIKPPVAEMGEGMQFHPELTFGYESELGAKPPRKLQLFLLFQELLSEEEKSLYHVREMEDQIDDFLQLRNMERPFPKLDVSLFNREQNKENFEGMLERVTSRKLKYTFIVFCNYRKGKKGSRERRKWRKILIISLRIWLEREIHPR